MSLVWYKKSQKGLLKDTKITNTEEKPFKCDQCGLSFSKKKNLERQQKTHTGEKPFKWNQCGKFSQTVQVLL